MSRTVADRRFQRRAMTSVSRGPRNFSSAFSGLRRRRRSGRLTPRLSRAPATHGDALSPPEEARMPFGEPLSAVRERDMELDDEMPVARLVQGPPGTLAPLDDTGQGQGGELPLRIALLQAGPQGGPLRGVLAEGQGVEEAESPGIGDPVERRRGALVLLVARALEQGGVAREEVQLPVFDGHSHPPKPGLRQPCRSSGLHPTPMSYVFGAAQSAAAGVAAKRSSAEGVPPPAMAFRATAATTSAAPPSMRMVTGSPSQRVPIKMASAGTRIWMSVIVVGRSFRYNQSETTMPKHVPNTTRYAKARTLAVVQCCPSESWSDASGASKRTDAQVPSATVGIGATVLRKRDWRIAAIAQVIGMSARTTVAMRPAAPSAVSGAPIRITVPPRPRTRPNTLRTERRSPATMKWASTAVHTGAAAPKTATRPLGTNCSDQKMIAQLQPILMTPTTTATAIVRLPRGKGWPSTKAMAVSTAATARALANANRNGGTSFTPILMAAHVDPQIRATLADPATTRSGGMPAR